MVDPKPDYLVCARRADIDAIGGPDQFLIGGTGYGHCVKCGAEVIFRVHAPAHAQKVCVQCFQQDAEAGEDMLVVITEKTADEWRMLYGDAPFGHPERKVRNN